MDTTLDSAKKVLLGSQALRDSLRLSTFVGDNADDPEHLLYGGSWASSQLQAGRRGEESVLRPDRFRAVQSFAPG